MRSRRMWHALASGLLLWVLGANVYSNFAPVRIRLASAAGLERPVASIALAGAARIPDPQLVLIYRVRNTGRAPVEVSARVSGLLVARTSVAPGASARVDASWNRSLSLTADAQVELSGTAEHWTVDYAELANLHGYTRGLVSFLILPPAQAYQPAPWWAFLVLLALALTGWVRGRSVPWLGWRWRLYRGVSGVVWALFAVAALSPLVSQFRLVLGLPTFFLAAAIVSMPAWLDVVVRTPLQRLRWLRQLTLLRRVSGKVEMGEERLFAPPGARVGGGLVQFATLAVLFCGLIAVVTWPQIRRLDSVPDLGDPLFSIWRIAWVAHQLPRNPLHLFDGNMFYPARLTLTYSDPVLVPAMLSAPLLWLGVHQTTAYTLLMLSGFAFSGVTMFLLVRALTGRRDAAAIAGVVFALYPYRLEHYSHLELQMTMWMPLLLWSLHRTVARGRLRDGLAVGLTFAMQMLSSLYYGMFLAVYLIPLAAALWWGRQRPRRSIWALAAGVVLAGALIAPVAINFVKAKPLLGERPSDVVRFYSAVPSDYLRPHFRVRWYAGWSGNGHPEREIFPGLAPVVLTAVALWPPLTVARVGYAAALLTAFDGSLGMNGTIYPLLYQFVGPFREMRVPARFAILVGLSLAILAGFGAARILERWPRWRIPLAALMLAVVIVEPWPLLTLEPVWRTPPSIYEALPSSPAPVVADFPMPADVAEYWFDTRYIYFSTFRWYRLVNGNSGFMPPSYDELIARMKEFPSDASLVYLRARGVDHLAVHGAFYKPEDYRRIVATLDARTDVTMKSSAVWEGAESRLYRLLR